MKQTIITILLAFVAIAVQAQTNNPKGLYKLTEVIHQDGKHVEAGFKQYKYCQENFSLMFNYSPTYFVNQPFTFNIT
ncbi:MAG: hypothetical protein IJT11_08945, partial [Bacteroidaceae bacterium]|nr:hypothetical protein [Bacteroidaceae bacterium]